MGYYSSFPKAIPQLWVRCVRVTHPCATKHIATPARLACVKPAASVRSEPGSNSPVGLEL